MERFARSFWSMKRTEVLRDALAFAEGKSRQRARARRSRQARSLPCDDTNPSISRISREAGSRTATVETRAAIPRSRGTGMPEMVEAGMEGMVETGNALVLPARVPEEVRNDG